ILEAGQVDQALSVVRALDTAADAAAVPLLLELATGEQHDLELRRRATAAAAKSVNGARQLITMAQQGKLPESLKQSAAAALNASADEQVRVAAAELFPLPASKDDTPLPSIQEL